MEKYIGKMSLEEVDTIRIQNKWGKLNLLFLLKTGIGTAAAIIIANTLGLAYSPSAGIITLLTIQNTKKETIFIALRRIYAFVVAVILSYGLFTAFGYTSVTFGAFALLFVALCNLLGLQDGISMNAVLTTHFLIEKRMDLPMLFNEIMLLLIGMSIGITINLIMPNNKKRIMKEQRSLEEDMKVILRGMANNLRNKDACLLQNGVSLNANEGNITTEEGNDISFAVDGIDFKFIDKKIKDLIKKAHDNAKNTLLTDTRYLIAYLDMREHQINVLKRIQKHINQIPVILQQTIPIADFMNHVADSFHEFNNVKGLLDEIEDLYEHYRKEQLPTTRAEFEYRAILFQILKELEYFLRIKRNFILEIEKQDMKSYWNSLG